MKEEEVKVLSFNPRHGYYKRPLVSHVILEYIEYIEYMQYMQYTGYIGYIGYIHTSNTLRLTVKKPTERSEVEK